LNDFFLIGKIKSVANEDGFLNILPFSDSLDRFFDLDMVFIDVFGGMRKFFVEDVEIVEKSIALKFKNFSSREDTEFLVGKDLFISSQDSVNLDENSFFIHDLIGCEVFRNGLFFGLVIDVLNLPANDVIVVRKEDDEEILLPLIEDYVIDIDVANKKILLCKGEEDLFDDED